MVEQHTSKPASEVQATKQKPLNITPESLEELMNYWQMIHLLVNYCIMTPALYMWLPRHASHKMYFPYGTRSGCLLVQGVAFWPCYLAPNNLLEQEPPGRRTAEPPVPVSSFLTAWDPWIRAGIEDMCLTCVLHLISDNFHNTCKLALRYNLLIYIYFKETFTIKLKFFCNMTVFSLTVSRSILTAI